MSNPFDELKTELVEIREEIKSLRSTTGSTQKIEIINREELCRRLGITEPTAIRYDKKGKIPSIRIGGNVRYNWPEVVNALQNN